MADRRIAEPADVSGALSGILQAAVKLRASDVHFEPAGDHSRIRIRVDGRLRILEEGEAARHHLLMNRLKILCGLDITERRRPQDGAFSQAFLDHKVDFRVSTVPVMDGEKAAVRILDDRSIDLDPESLGLSQKRWHTLKDWVRARHGMVVLTGPTGSGKTTTMYTLLKLLNEEHRHIITLEDPVEYRLTGINQIQVHERIGLTFARGLRSILRQDPEVIMVGEIRDPETAEIAVRAAITGHLVLTTLHTNDSHGAVTRLLDMGIEPYLIAASLSGICSQRLVRRLCTCRQTRTLQEKQTELFMREGVAVPDEVPEAAGCERCHGGFSGRTAITEVLPVTESLRTGILHREDSDRLKLRTPRFETLLSDGLKKVVACETTLGEVLDATRE